GGVIGECCNSYYLPSLYYWYVSNWNRHVQENDRFIRFCLRWSFLRSHCRCLKCWCIRYEWLAFTRFARCYLCLRSVRGLDCNWTRDWCLFKLAVRCQKVARLYRSVQQCDYHPRF